MSIQDFNYIQEVSVLEDDTDTMKLALIVPSENFELTSIMVKVYLQGTFTTEKMKLKLHSSDNYNIILAESNEIELDNSGTNFLGWLRFDFERPQLFSGLTYHLNAISSGYTRNADIKYISFVHDWPIRFYSSTNVSYTGIPSAYPKALQIFGRQ